MKKLDVVAAVLLVVGGLNWGVIALGGPDLVASLFGGGSPVSRLVYGVVGLSAVWQALQWKAIQHRWMPRCFGVSAPPRPRPVRGLCGRRGSAARQSRPPGPSAR